MQSDHRKRANLRDVAAAARTSVATVSRVLNDSGYYSEKIRTRVQKAAERLNYQPNLRAKSLRQRHSNSVGLLIPNLLNQYYTALADDISQLLLYSFGLQNQEFVVVYETDDLPRFSDLVNELRDTEGRRYTLRDTPVHSAIYHPAEETLALWK